MRRIISLSVVLTLVITSTGLSQDRRRSQQPQQSPFQQVFRLRGVEFTEDQQAQVEELRKKYTAFSALLDVLFSDFSEGGKSVSIVLWR